MLDLRLAPTRRDRLAVRGRCPPSGTYGYTSRPTQKLARPGARASSRRATRPRASVAAVGAPPEVGLGSLLRHRRWLHDVDADPFSSPPRVTCWTRGLHRDGVVECWHPIEFSAADDGLAYLFGSQLSLAAQT